VRGRGILRSLRLRRVTLTSSEVYERSVEGHHGSVERESFAKVV
jgi:hypothetical protein